MFKLSRGFVFATICVVVSSSGFFLSDEVAQFQFTKAENGSDEFNFEYQLNNGKVFRGQTIVLMNNINPVYLMMGADSFYWVQITDDEYQNQQPFLKFVRRVEQTDSALAYFKDNEYEYVIDTEGKLYRNFYITEWDLQNVAFKPEYNERKTFKYIISSLNNSKKHFGTTNYETDPHTQQDRLPTFFALCDNVFEVNFTDEDLDRVEFFYKNVNEIVMPCPVGTAPAFPGTQEHLNPNALKSLIG